MVTVSESTTQEASKVEELKAKGNKLFLEGNYDEAIEVYKDAASLCSPEHDKDSWSKLHSNIAACYKRQQKYELAIESCNEALKVGAFSEKPLIRRGETYAVMKKYTEALADYNEALEKYPNMTDSAKAEVKTKMAKCKSDMQPKQSGSSEDADEKLKEEMLAKLKDLGNMVLRPFGLSTCDFQVNDDGHGGKTISMKPPSNT